MFRVGAYGCSKASSGASSKRTPLAYCRLGSEGAWEVGFRVRIRIGAKARVRAKVRGQGQGELRFGFAFGVMCFGLGIQVLGLVV